MEQRAQTFAARQGFALDLTRKLGFGSDGTVWRTSLGTAIKVFERLRPYGAEKACYQRLRDLNITEILGFTVPQLESFDDELAVIEMTIVTPPYLLDFGKTYLDRAPDYSPEVIADDEAFRRELFDDDWPTVEQILDRLEAIGIYYVDARPGNITFD